MTLSGKFVGSVIPEPVMPLTNGLCWMSQSQGIREEPKSEEKQEVTLPVEVRVSGAPGFSYSGHRSVASRLTWENRTTR